MASTAGLWRWVALALGSLAALLLLWPGLLPFLDPAGPAGRDAEGRPLERGARPGDAPGVDLPSATGPAPAVAGSDAPATDPPAPPDGLRVQVLSAADRKPVEGARVWLLRETESSLALGWASLAEPLLSEPSVTDDRGVVVLAWGDGEAPRRVVAQAPGLRCSEARAERAGTRVVVLLEPGLAIEGRVEDLLGRPIADVEVVAEAARRPRGAGAGRADAGRLPMRGAEAVRATSDSDGLVRLDGLSPGVYRIVPTAPGYVLTSDLPPSTPDPLPGGDGVLAQAGDRSVRIVLGRVRAIALHVVEDDRGQSVAAPWISVTVLPQGRGSVRTFASYARPARLPDALLGTGRPDAQPQALPGADPAFLRTLVPADIEPVDGQVEVEVRAPGYATAKARVPLLDPATLPPVPATAADDAGFTRVVLAPAGPGGTAALRLACPRELHGVVRPATRLLTLCRLEDGLRVHRRGVLEPDGSALFHGLPAGVVAVSVYDGLSRSEPLRLELLAGATVEARAAFDPPSGVSVTLLDPVGQRVFDADLLVLAPVGRNRGLPDASWATRYVAEGALVVPLLPGTYRYAVNKRGVGYDAGTLEVPDGGVARLTARLGPLKRFMSGADRGPR